MQPNLITSAQKLLNSHHRFATDDVLLQLPHMSSEELDTLPFGVIGLDDLGFVLQYNQYECTLAQRTKEETLGKDFFQDVAPCTKSPIFSDLFFYGVQQNDLRAFVSYLFNFRMDPTHVWIHMYRCPTTKTNWILIQKKES